MHVFLETERLILRRFTPDDAGLLVELDSDPEVVRYVPDEPVTFEEARDGWLPHILGYYERFAGLGFWAAIERSSGDFLGWFHFRPEAGHPEDEPELGYRLRRAAWGKGYATEGSRALVDAGFRDHGARRVLAAAYPANRASCRVLEKAGLRLIREYTTTVPGPDGPVEEATVEYALSRDEWETRNAAAGGVPARPPRTTAIRHDAGGTARPSPLAGRPRTDD